MCKKILISLSIVIFAFPLFAGEGETYTGAELGSPVREGARTVLKELFHQPIHSIEVRWKAKKMPGNRRATARGWLFLDGAEFGFDEKIGDMWNYSTWDIMGMNTATFFQLGIERDDDEASELQVDIDWVRVTYH